MALGEQRLDLCGPILRVLAHIRLGRRFGLGEREQHSSGPMFDGAATLPQGVCRPCRRMRLGRQRVRDSGLGRGCPFIDDGNRFGLRSRWVVDERFELLQELRWPTRFAAGFTPVVPGDEERAFGSGERYVEESAVLGESPTSESILVSIDGLLQVFSVVHIEQIQRRYTLRHVAVLVDLRTVTAQNRRQLGHRTQPGR